jgi:hypothetical protein
MAFLSPASTDTFCHMVDYLALCGGTTVPADAVRSGYLSSRPSPRPPPPGSRHMSTARLNDVRCSESIMPHTVEPGDTEYKPLITAFYSDGVYALLAPHANVDNPIGNIPESLKTPWPCRDRFGKNGADSLAGSCFPETCAPHCPWRPFPPPACGAARRLVPRHSGGGAGRAAGAVGKAWIRAGGAQGCSRVARS